MALPRVFRLPEHNKFNYTPLYYNKKKEELEARRAHYKQKKQAIEDGSYKPDFSGAFKKRYDRRSVSNIHEMSTVRVLIIAAFLAVIAFLLIKNSDLIGRMFNVFLE